MMDRTTKNLCGLHVRRFIMDARVKPAHDMAVRAFAGMSEIYSFRRDESA
jgi:hypothetical protein